MEHPGIVGSPLVGLGRRIGIGGVAAVLGATAVLGLGSRLAMRLSGAVAIVRAPEIRGRLTGDGFSIGRISLEGSLGLLVFGGLLGSILAAAYWVLMKDRLLAWRRPSLMAGLAAAAIGGNQFVHPDNIDFVILEPVIMNVMLYPLVAGLAGVAIVAIDGALTRQGFGSGSFGSLLLTVFALVGAALVGALANLGDNPTIAGELAVLLAGAAPAWAYEARRRNPASWSTTAGTVAVVGVIGFEWLHLVRSVWEILAP
jgi:TRAP-type C4-dicarboxylate transport system permease small subunit